MSKTEKCGCKFGTDRGREIVIESCMEHEREWIQRHVEAVSSCSHIHRERNNDLVS